MKWNQDTESKIGTLINTAVVTKDLGWYRKVVIPKITNGLIKYQNVERATGVPAVMVAMIHARESASDLGKFQSYLGNGQPLSQKTTIVPRGRGPFKSWESGAIDAFKLMGLDKIEKWTLERVLYECERYNGFGYHNRGLQSPYVWGGTNHYTKGRYVSDGKFSPTSVSTRAGAFVYYKMITQAERRFKLPDDTFKVVAIPEEPKQKGLWATILSLFSELFVFLKNDKDDSKATGAIQAKDQSLLDMILQNSPGIGPKMTRMAAEWYWNAAIINKKYMVLVDFDLHESKPRMYVVDRETGKSEVYKVAHGTNSDRNKDGFTDSFSNVPNSRQSSLGAMVMTAQYGNADGGWSKFPFALKLKGLQNGLNNKVSERAVVFHSSNYINDVVGKSIGDSWGCFAVSEKTAKSIIDKIDEGCLLFAYHRSLDEM